MMVVACNKCGEAVQDDPQEAIGATHINSFGEVKANCGGTFVEMSEDAAELLAQGSISVAQFGTAKDK